MLVEIELDLFCYSYQLDSIYYFPFFPRETYRSSAKGLQFWISSSSILSNIGKYDCMVIMQMSNMRG